MIKTPPVTAKGYYYYGKLMWGRIVKLMEHFPGGYLDQELKERVWDSLFSFKLNGEHCFACVWKANNESECWNRYENCNKYCLLEFGESEDCLGGLYDIATGITSKRIEAARKIRDLPMKDKWK